MLKKFYRVSECGGVSVRIQPGGDMEVSACLIIRDAKKLDFAKKLTSISDIRHLREQLPAKTLIGLNLSGKGVLLKQTGNSERIHAGNFNQILPNAAYEDFYIQQFVSGEKSFVALIRKTEADSYMRLLGDLGFVVGMLSLGPYPADHILSQLNVYGDPAVFDGHSISRNEQGEWIAYAYHAEKRSPFPLKVESEPVAEQLVLAYAVAFQLLLHEQLEPVCANATGPENALHKFVEGRKFRTEGAFTLVIFFILLLGNFILFSWLNVANTKLLSQVGVSDQGVADMNRLTAEVGTKKKLLVQLGWDSGINKSALIDGVASVLPDGVTLERITVNPFDKAASERYKTQAFDDHELIITGNSEQLIPVNEWIARIKTKTWAKDVQLVSYLIDQEKNTGEFTIKIHF